MPPGKRQTQNKQTGLHIDSHRALIAKRHTMIEALQRRPELLPLLALNPVQAFHDAGVTMSPEIADHVMESIRFPPAAREERDRLTAQLTDALGEEPQPTDGAWLARTVFDKLKVRPLDLAGQRPSYHSATDPKATRRLVRLLKPQRPAAADAPPPHAALTFGLNRQSDRLLDLDSPAPPCPPAKHRPRRLTLAELWFYRDQHELIPALLRLGVVLRSGVMLASPSAYKHIAAGSRRNQLTTWISAVEFPPRGGKPRGGGGAKA